MTYQTRTFSASLEERGDALRLNQEQFVETVDMAVLLSFCSPWPYNALKRNESDAHFHGAACCSALLAVMLQLWPLASVCDPNGSPLDCVDGDVDGAPHLGRRLAVGGCVVRCTEGEWMLRLICSLRPTQRLISTDNSLDSMKAATMAMSTVEHDTLNLMSPAHSPHRCSALQKAIV